MTAFDDAKINLEAAVVAAKGALSNQDQPAQLNAAFGPLMPLARAAQEWVKSFTSLQAINAASERDFDQAINAEAVKGLRNDVQAFLERLAGTRQALIKLAERARLP